MSQEDYLVRGAKLKCNHGSHSRKLNLPLCHGVYAGDTGKYPVVNKSDYVVDINVMPFGVCDGPNSACGAPVLVLPQEEGGGTVFGVTCTPIIAKEWLSANSKMIVDGQEGITTKSYLICEYGGIIAPEDSGQEG